MVRIRCLDRMKGDQLIPELDQPEMTAEEAASFILQRRDEGLTRFGVWEGEDTQLELEMATRTGILQQLKERAGQILRLVPVVSGG